MSTKRFLITGANSGLGKTAALKLAGLGHHVIRLCSDAGRGQRALLEIRRQSENTHVVLMLADLASQSSIRTFAMDFLYRYNSLHGLINCAGIRVLDRQTTEDGSPTRAIHGRPLGRERSCKGRLVGQKD